MVDDISDNDLTVACGFLAAQAVQEHSTNFEDLGLMLVEFQKIAKAEGMGRIARLVPIELGVQSCIVPICLTAKALNNRGDGWDLSVLDADGAGRAVPMISATTFAAASAAAAAAASDAGASDGKKVELFPAIFGGQIPEDKERGVDAARVWMRFQGNDPTAYHLHTSATGALVGFVDGAAALVCWPMKSKGEVEKALPSDVRGTMSLSLGLGSKFTGKTANPVQDGMKFLESEGRKTFHIFKGTIESDPKDQSRLKLTNGKDSLLVLSTGENMVAISEGKVKAMAPDSICYVTENGTAFSSVEVEDILKKEGTSVIVHVVGIPAREEIRKSALVKRAFDFFRVTSMSQEKSQGNSAHAAAGGGVNVNVFIPIEQLNASSSVAPAN
jgi:DUF917 family protein